MNVIDEMAEEAINDDYFHYLFQIAEKISFDAILNPSNLSKNYYSFEEYNDILTFADILSLSSSSNNKNLALKIISSLNHVYNKDSKYKYFSRGIMIRMGNFPAYKILSEKFENDEYTLPLDIRIEKEIKETLNKDVYSDKIFTDAQYDIYESLLNKNHFSFSGPTSFGKSFVLTSFIKTLISENKLGLNIVFLVPTKALVSQTIRKFKEIINDIEGYYLSSSPDIPILLKNNKYHYIFVFTPERLLHYFSNSDNPSIEYVFVDEAQKVLSDDVRSVVYYHSISLADRKSCKLFFSSPNISNTDIFLRLFNKTASENKSVTESPVCQNRIFIDMINNEVKAFSDLGNILSFNTKLPTSLPEILKYISQNVDKDNPKSLVYCNTVEDTINCAKQMANSITPIDSKALNEAADEISAFIHKDYYLVDLVRRGVGFHFGKLPQKIRDIVEKLYENGELQYLFCTSTLLEGVNLPAQNIFILNNQIGNKDFKSVDFWNLAGRAGRLAKELSGNVICIRWENKEGRWNSLKDIEIIKNKKLEFIETDIITGKSNFYKNIMNAAENKKFTRNNISETQRRVYNAFSNVLISHFSNDQTSFLRNEFQKKEPASVKKIVEIQRGFTIPNEILSQFPLIKVTYQNDIWNSTTMLTPKCETPTYDNCLNMLNHLCVLYNWKEEESRGKNPLLPKANTDFLKHYAALMNDWMNSISISEMISKSIYNQNGKKIKNGYYNGQINFEIFNSKNKNHVNIVINNTINEIDSVIRYKLKNYFENYYTILRLRDGVNEAGEDWALYMEHGTKNKKQIEVQKLGVPRHLSKMFLNDFMKYLEFNIEGELVSLNGKMILEKIDADNKKEYIELKDVLLDNCIVKQQE